MTLDEYATISGFFFIIYGTYLFVLMVALLLLQLWTLSCRLDKYLFNENYFTPQEMIMFSSFPLSLLKTLGYIRLITFPNSLRKRFGNASARDKISVFDLFLSHLTIAILAVSAILILNVLIAGVSVYVYVEVLGLAL